MSRAIHVFRTPDRFVAGTVGQPGNRTFYLQAVHEKRVISVVLEKQQVAVLAERIAALLLEINRRFGTPVPPETDVEDLSPLVTPVDAEFRVGTMGLGWDSEAQTVVVELLAVSETEFDASVVLDDAEDGPDAVRVFLTPESRASVRDAGPTGSSRRAGRRARCATSPSTRRATSACAPTAIGGRLAEPDDEPDVLATARRCDAANSPSSDESGPRATPRSCARRISTS